ncbi:hypothetical protein HDU88_007524 [Geranomyces variabilis]|nr:hypothetical protein HDU88_007524 [Geranomyces variabilis]
MLGVNVAEIGPAASLLKKLHSLGTTIALGPHCDQNKILESCEELQTVANELKRLDEDDNNSAALTAAADQLDDAGVQIWNATVKRKTAEFATLPPNVICHSKVVRHVPLRAMNGQLIFHVPKVRGAAVALLAIAASKEMNERVAIKLSGLSLKTGKCWLGKAREFYELCSKYLEGPQVSPSAEPSEYSKLAMMFQAHMAELEFLDSGSLVAFMTMRRVLESSSFSSFSQRELCDLCQICFKCGRKAAKQSDAIQWCKLALDAIDTSDASAGKEPDLKAEVLWFLANLYMDAGALDKAKQAIDVGLEESPNALCGHYLKLKFLAQKGADAKELEAAFAVAVERCNSSLKKSAQFKMLLSMIHLLATRTSPESAVAGIEAALANFADTPAEADQRETLRILKMHVLLSASDPAKAITREIDAIVESVCVANAQPTLAKTYRLILWQSADKATQEGRWNDAIQWYMYSRRLLMDDPTDAKNAAIIRRKLAVCHLELKSYQDAYDALEISDSTAEHSVESQFIAFVAKMELGDNIVAIGHLTKISVTPATIQYFISAAQLAYSKGDKNTLKQVLKHVVMSPVDWNVNANKASLLAVLRCLIRLSANNLDSGHTEAELQDILKYIKKAYTLLVDWRQDPARDAAACAAEMDWMYRTTWNVALAAASAGDTETSCLLYDLTAEVIALAEEPTLELLQTQKVCFFAVTAGFLSLSRKPSLDTPAVNASRAADHSQHLSRALKALSAMRNVCTRIATLDPDKGALGDDLVVHQSVYLEFEIRVRESMWTHVENIIEYAESVQAPVQVFERMADIVTKFRCPSSVVFLTIQATLDTILRRDPNFDLTKFSQWFRVLIRTSLVANADAALGLYKQVLTILTSTSGEGNSYPKEEIEWLMVTAWNLCCEKWSSNEPEKGREWCELAIGLADHVEASSLVDQIRQNYSDLIAT